MRGKQRFLIVGLASTMVFALGSGVLLNLAPAQEGPKYYSDGARPSREPNRSYKEAEGCVPFSEEHPDTKICGELPPGWEPGSAPGHYDDYPQICEEAAAHYREMFSRDLPGEEIDVSSCYVVSTGRYPAKPLEDSEYLVNFGLVRDINNRVTIPLSID